VGFLVQCFSHEALLRCFAGCADVSVHKHCLHAFNFTVKVRYEDFVEQTGYLAGPHPDGFGSVYSKKDLEEHLVFRPEVNAATYFGDARRVAGASAARAIVETPRRVVKGPSSVASSKRMRKPTLTSDEEESGGDTPRARVLVARDETPSRTASARTSAAGCVPLLCLASSVVESVEGCLVAASSAADRMLSCLVHAALCGA
jgi:hypothetical protein